MRKKSSISTEEKLDIVKRYLNGEKSYVQFAKEVKVNESSIRSWVRNYKAIGISGITTTSSNNSYPVELKTSAVKDYLKGAGSLNDICTKYKIRSKSQLLNWISKYNSHENIKHYKTGRTLIMTKGRNSTFDERIDIVKYCIEHNKDFNETAQKFQVSYQQVRNWTLKYEKVGVDGLLDGRGKCKNEAELTELEKLKAQFKLLEAKNKRLEMENEVLKKLEQIERR